MFVVWICYIAVGLFVGMLLEWTIRGRKRDTSTITPADLLPIFPLMLAGTLASGLCSKLPLDQAGYVIVVGYMLQAMGFWIGLLKYVAFFAFEKGSHR
jgi:tellurite resistance protein TehA-like permease